MDKAKRISELTKTIASCHWDLGEYAEANDGMAPHMDDLDDPHAPEWDENILKVTRDLRDAEVALTEILETL